MKRILFPLFLLLLSLLSIYVLQTRLKEIPNAQAQTVCTIIGTFCDKHGKEWASYLESTCSQRLTGNNCVYNAADQCEDETSCTGTSICDCSNYCVFPNSLPLGKGCCGDKGSVCQSGLTCTANACTAPAATNTPIPTLTLTLTPTASPTRTTTFTPTPTIAQENPISTGSGRIEIPADPNKKAYFAPNFLTIAVQGMFFIITLAVIFSVIH